MKIDNYKIEKGKTFIIAELSANHGGDVNIAIETIRAAKRAGVDAHFSLDEVEFTAMVKAVRTAEKMLGEITYEMDEKKKKSREFSRSLFVVKDIKAGEIITEENVRSIRPGHGLHPKYLHEIIGKIAKLNIEKGTPFSMDFISP